MRNLWVEAGLVNGSLGILQNIFFYEGSKPPQLPMYATVSFDDNICLPWDIRYPNIVQITPVCRGNHKQVPLCMAWALTIHKSKGLTLERTTIDIGNAKRQGFTFTRISKVKYLDGLRISSPFKFTRYAKMSQSVYSIISNKKEQRLQSISL